MKRILLVLFTLISLNAFSQLQVKEGSFKYVPGGVIDNKAEYTDGNDLPMALIKISTENIPEQERMRLVFVGNRATQIIKKPRTGSMWIYISADAATFIDIRHPDYGTYKYYLPEELCDYCVYEMVLQYIPIVPVAANEPAKIQKTYFIVQADQTDALVYIDGEMLGAKEARKLVDVGTTHTYKIECKLYYEESGNVTINDKTIVNKTLRPAFGYLNISSSPEQGANVWVDGDLIGVTPIKTDKLASGTYTVRVAKDMYKMKEQSFTVTDGQTTNVTLDMFANFVNVTINTDSQSDIYVDEEYKGKGKWTGRLSDGAHIFEARKSNHKTSVKSLELVLGETKTITLDAPTPINGNIDVGSSPMGATIYIDGKNYGETPNYISDILIGEHELKLTKQGCTEIKKTITIKEDETLTINEKLQISNEVTSAKQNADKIVVKDEGISSENGKVFEGEIFKVVEVMPEFPGGAGKMMEFIQKNLKYPMTAQENGIQGRVFVNFVIEPDGSITNVTAMRGIGGGCDEEAIRVVQSMPNWKPGKQRGVAVRSSFTVPIIFKLQ
ncbi:MAG: TonB family protein [Bacteroidales bacterium]|nr:TonB family protein [Bacteroidales bacterium]